MENRNILSKKHKRICLLREIHPFWTQKQISGEIGLTIQRVGQVLKQNDLPTRSFHPARGFTFCPVCSKVSSRGRKICLECREERFYEILRCRACYSPIRMLKSKHRAKMQVQNNVYCSRQCYYKGRIEGYS
jgi:hypothetical protein